MTLSIKTNFLKGEFDEAMRDIYSPISKAGQAAIKEAGAEVKADARQSIAQSGFSRRWQNALRVDIYPRKGESADAVAHVYHKIPYAGVFEEGAEIGGSPYLWVPMRNTPKKMARKRLTPERFASGVGDLVSMRSKKGRPMLGARMAVSKAAKAKGPPYKITLSALHRGSQGGTTASGRKRHFVTVPLFIGVKKVSVPKKFGVSAAVKRAAKRLPELYLKHLKVD